MNGYVNLDYVVMSTISERGGDDRHYEKLLQLAIKAYQDINFNDAITNVKTALVEVNSQNTALFPADYVNYIAIALQYQGREIPLTRNKNIVLPSTQSCGEWERETTTSTNEGFHDSVNYEDSYSNDVSYTVGGAFNAAYYRIDEANRQIVFLQQRFTGMVVTLVYKAVGLGADTVIPRDAVPAMQAYIDWRIDKQERGTPLGQIEMSRLEWVRERNKLYARRHSYTADELMDMRFLNTHRGLK